MPNSVYLCWQISSYVEQYFKIMYYSTNNNFLQWRESFAHISNYRLPNSYVLNFFVFKTGQIGHFNLHCFESLSVHSRLNSAVTNGYRKSSVWILISTFSRCKLFSLRTHCRWNCSHRNILSMRLDLIYRWKPFLKYGSDSVTESKWTCRKRFSGMKVTLSIFKRRERRGGPRQAVKKKFLKKL